MGVQVEEVLMILSGILAALTSCFLGKRYAEELDDLFKGLAQALAVAKLISLAVALMGFIAMYTFSPPAEISTAEQFTQFVLNALQPLLAFLKLWLQNVVASIPSGLLSYTISYCIASIRNQALLYTPY